MTFTEFINSTWNDFYVSLTLRQIGLRNFSFFQLFVSFRFLIMFSSSDLFESWYAYSLNHYLDNFSPFFEFIILLEFLHTFLIQNTWKNAMILDPQRWKQYIFVSGYSTLLSCIGLGKNSVCIRLLSKKIYLRFWLQCYYGACDLEKKFNWTRSSPDFFSSYVCIFTCAQFSSKAFSSKAFSSNPFRRILLG